MMTCSKLRSKALAFMQNSLRNGIEPVGYIFYSKPSIKTKQLTRNGFVNCLMDLLIVFIVDFDQVFLPGK